MYRGMCNACILPNEVLYIYVSCEIFAVDERKQEIRMRLYLASSLYCESFPKLL